jgi:hypothetical protein
MKGYLETFTKAEAAAKSRQEAIGEMKNIFLGVRAEGLLLVHSVNFHVKEPKLKVGRRGVPFLQRLSSSLREKELLTVRPRSP